MTQLDLAPECRVDPNVKGNDERYTTRETLTWCMRRAGVEAFDVDVAACLEAHHGRRWLGVHDDGLQQPWFFFEEDRRIWCNPPWSDVMAWIERAWSELRRAPADAVVCMLLPNNTEQPWWQRHVEPYRDPPGRWEPEGLLPPGQRADRLNTVRDEGRLLIVGQPERWRLTTHFLPGRTKYGHPGNPEAVGVGSPPMKSVLLVWRAAA